MGFRHRIRVWACTALLAATGCSDGSGHDAKETSGGGQRGDEGADSANGGTGSGAGGDDGTAEPLPPEQEETLSFELPQAGASSVYVPNPTTDRVAIVSAATFAIETVRAGSRPTYTATVPGKDVAIVLNVGTRDASLLRTMDGHTTVQMLPVGHDANAVAIAPDGGHAVIYFDASYPNQVAQSFQDVTILDLTPGQEAARGVSVGFRPRSVSFSADGDAAFVITEDGISVIDLQAADAGAFIAPLVSVGDALGDALSTDVAITPNGKFALARRTGDTTLRLVDLADGTLATLDLRTLQAVPQASDEDAGSAPKAALDGRALEVTDLDIAPDGTFALAVARSHGALIRIPLPLGFRQLNALVVTAVPGQLVGSVTIANTGTLALAYTTAAPVEGLAIVDLLGVKPLRGVRLRKSVRAVALSSDGSRALILHATSPGSPDEAGLDAEARIDSSEGYSLLDTGTGFAKLQLSSARLGENDLVFVGTGGARRMFATLRDDNLGVRSLHMADLESFQVTTTSLVAPPSSIGVVPGVERVFVGQELTGGMITFVNAQTGEVEKAVTGFELTSRIRQ